MATSSTVTPEQNDNKMEKFSEGERKFIRDYSSKLVITSTLSTTFLGAALALAYTGIVDLTPKSVKLDTLQDRLVFTLRYESIQLVWIILAMYNVIRKRLSTPALDPTRGYERLVQNAKNILNNSIEHGLVFMISQLIISTDITPELCGRMIPMLNILYFVGRLLYAIGYPNNRSFGFVINNFIIILTVSYNVFGLTRMYL